MDETDRSSITYDPLLDPHLKRFMSSSLVRQAMVSSGVIDAEGRFIDVQRNRARECILERETKRKEREEALLMTNLSAQLHRMKVQGLEEQDMYVKRSRIEMRKAERRERSAALREKMDSFCAPQLRLRSADGRKKKSLLVSVQKEKKKLSPRSIRNKPRAWTVGSSVDPTSGPFVSLQIVINGVVLGGTRVRESYGY